MELLKHELYKIASRKAVWIAAAFFTLVTLFFVYNQADLIRGSYGDMDGFYRTTFQGHEGEVSAETALSAQAEQEKLAGAAEASGGSGSRLSVARMRRWEYDQTVSDAKANQDRRAGRLEEYRQAMESSLVKYGKSSFAYRNASLRYNMVRRLALPGVYFTYPWDNIVDFPVNLGFLILVGMILLGVSPLFSDEYASGVDALILSTKWGKRKTAGVKVLAGVLYCAATALFSMLMNLAGYFFALGTTGAGAPLQAIFKYLASPYAWTIGQYFLVEMLVFAVAGVCFGLLVMLVSALSPNALIPFFACGCLVGFTAGLKAVDLTLPASLMWLEDFSYSEAMRVAGLFSGYKTYNVLGHPVLYGPLALAVLVGISVPVLWLTIRAFRRHQIENA